MEEANDLATVWVSSCNVGSLESIAVDASKRQILSFDEAAMLSGDHVINLEWCKVECRGHVAVFATGIGSLPHLANQSSIHYVVY
jgi:hypothetical protein